MQARQVPKRSPCCPWFGGRAGGPSKRHKNARGLRHWILAGADRPTLGSDARGGRARSHDHTSGDPHHGAKTRMTLSDGPYPAGRDHAEAGWSAAFDNLAALVAG
jgi:hypothetical protein